MLGTNTNKCNVSPLVITVQPLLTGLVQFEFKQQVQYDPKVIMKIVLKITCNNPLK
jgi:hypothetical protein